MIKTEIKDVLTDENGNIKVVTHYLDDNDVLVQEGVTRYSTAVLPIEDIESLIAHDIEHHAQTLMVRQFSKKMRDDYNPGKDVAGANQLKTKLVGTKAQFASGVLKTPKRDISVDGKSVIGRVNK